MKKSLLTMLAALLLIIAAVGFKNIYSCRMPIKNRGIRDALNSGDLDILFIGSSTFRANLDMTMLDEATGGRAYDVCYGGNHMAAASVQYREIRKRSGSRYGLIAFEMGPMILTQSLALSDSRVIWDLSWEGKKELWEIMKKGGVTSFPMMYEYFVTSGMDDLLTFPVTEPFYATRYYKGAKTDETGSPGKEVLEGEEFDISGEEIVEAQTEAVREIIRQCRSDGQAFIFIESPVYHRFADDRKYLECRREFEKILKEEDAPFILADEVDFDNRDPDLFEDMNHMSLKGRREYTGELIKRLSARIDNKD